MQKFLTLFECFAVQISSSETFRGIFLQVRDSVDGDALGQWDVPPSGDYKVIDCNEIPGSGLTHTDGTDKNFPVEFEWSPSSSGTYQV